MTSFSTRQDSFKIAARTFIVWRLTRCIGAEVDTRRFVLIGSCAESGDDDGDNDGAIVTNYRAVVAWTGVLRFRSTEYPVHQDNNNNHNQNHKNNIDDSGGDHITEKYRSNPFFVWYPNKTPTVVSKTFL